MRCIRAEIMKTSDFYYDLPERLIAQTPLDKRDTSRMLALNKDTGAIEHRHFYNLPEYLRAGDTLVLNNSRVIPARLLGVREDTGYPIELVLLTDKGDGVWECLTRPGKKCRVGAKLSFGEGKLTATVEDILPDGGNRLIRFHYEGIFLEILEELGMMPLPPYIKEKLEDPERYQTVYSKTPGSAAAPTAGLHFTPELLQQIKDMGVNIAYVTLHVGLGTFRPVKVEDVSEHVMHSEFYMLDEENAAIINNTRTNGGRIFRCRHNGNAHTGNHRRRGRFCSSVLRLDQYLYLSGLPVQGCRLPCDQFPSAGKHTDDADFCIRIARYDYAHL